MEDLMTPMITALAAVIGSLLASSGFWAYVQKRPAKTTALERLVLGLACNEIIKLGMQYIGRGQITTDEYENLDKYLYKPYAEVGGNGLAERVMNDVRKLPVCQGVILNESERKNLVQSECIPRPSGVPSAAAE